MSFTTLNFQFPVLSSQLILLGGERKKNLKNEKEEKPDLVILTGFSLFSISIVLHTNGSVKYKPLKYERLHIGQLSEESFLSVLFESSS